MKLLSALKQQVFQPICSVYNLHSIAKEFAKDQTTTAFKRFDHLSSEAKSQIFEHVSKLDKKLLGDPLSAKFAFYGKYGQDVSNQVRAQAISEYASSVLKQVLHFNHTDSAQLANLLAKNVSKMEKVDHHYMNKNMPSAYDMLAAKVKSIAEQQLCPFLCEMDKKEYAVLQKEDKAFYEKTGWSRIAAIMAVALSSIAAGLASGGLAFWAEGAALTGIAISFGSGAAVIGAGSGLFVYSEKKKEDGNKLAEEIRTDRRDRLAQKMRAIQNQLSSSACSASEKQQLENAHDHFENIKKG